MPILRRTRRLLCLLACLHQPLSAAAEPVSLNFQNADIETVIQAIGKLSGTNFIIDPRVKGKLNIVTHAPVAPDLAYQILLSSLRLQGYTAVDGAGVVKIVPESEAKLHALPVARGTQGASTLRGDRLVTQVFALRHESAAQMLPVIRPLVAPNNSINAFPSNNVLVVTDYAENIARIASVIESLDVAQGDISVIELRHASAVDLAPLITRLLAERGASNQGTPGAGQAVQVLAEPRSNSLLIRADMPSRIAAVRQLVASLDRAGAAGNVNVVYLRNADAGQVAATLSAAMGASGGQSTPASPTLTADRGASTDSGSMTTSASTQVSSERETTSAAQLGGAIIQADTVNNAVIINAPDALYRNLRQVIEQLDRRRVQVYIEALIAEISTERAAEFGIQWAGGGANGKVGVVGGTAFGSGGNNLLQLAAGAASGNPTLPGNGLTLALGGGSVNVPGVGEIINLGFLARFLENEVRANILSTPNIVTLDNEEAKIVVGRNVPFVTGQYTSTGSGSGVSNPFQTIERKDVGLTLKVKPQISEGGSIRLAIYQEASAVVDSTDTGNGPVTTKRSIESMVLVDDGAIIALGGLVEDSYSGGQEKVPLLGDIPYAGSLFRYDNRRRSKTNLVVFLRPVILRTQEDYSGLTQSRYDYVIGAQRTIAPPNQLLRGEPRPAELPPFAQPAPATPWAPVEDAEIRGVAR